MQGKLTIENKKEIYNCRKNGDTIINLTKKFNIDKSTVKYLIRLIDMHGFKILEKTERPLYSNELKLKYINRVLVDGQSIISSAIELGLNSPRILSLWVKKYIENGYTIEKTKGLISMKKSVTNKYNSLTIEEKLEQIEQENLYLKAENEYLKKLKALAQNSKK